MSDWQELAKIYMQPWCWDCDRYVDSDPGRMWCEDKQEPCGVCGRDWVEYTLAAPPTPLPDVPAVSDVRE